MVWLALCVVLWKVEMFIYTYKLFVRVRERTLLILVMAGLSAMVIVVSFSVEIFSMLSSLVCFGISVFIMAAVTPNYGIIRGKMVRDVIGLLSVTVSVALMMVVSSVIWVPVYVQLVHLVSISAK